MSAPHDAEPVATIRPAAPADLAEVLTLLAAAGLPDDGVVDAFGDFIVARGGDGALVGCAGVERHGRTALLRSVAVAERVRGSGLGTRLVAEALSRAASSGLDEVVLLTTTARDFFVEHFGFGPADRAAYDERLGASSEWRLPRCSSAACLRLALDAGKGEPA